LAAEGQFTTMAWSRQAVAAVAGRRLSEGFCSTASAARVGKGLKCCSEAGTRGSCRARRTDFQTRSSPARRSGRVRGCAALDRSAASPRRTSPNALPWGSWLGLEQRGRYLPQRAKSSSAQPMMGSLIRAQLALAGLSSGLTKPTDRAIQSTCVFWAACMSSGVWSSNAQAPCAAERSS
jgi:hypothetical protein